MFRKLTLCLVVLLGVLLRADTAVAIDQAACCLPTTSRLDGLMNPTKGGDEKFFSRPGGPPNILFVVDTSSTMHAWPKAWPSTRGCSDSFLNGLGYDNKETYPRLWTGLSSQSAEWWANASYYDAPATGYGTLFANRPFLGLDPATNKEWAAPWTSAEAACKTIPGIDGLLGVGSNLENCKSCLDNRGYYIHDGSTRRVKGNFLNFYAPRDSGAVKVLTDVVRDLREVRFGVLGLQTRDQKVCWGLKAGTTKTQCLCMLNSMGPTCDKSFPMDGSSVESNRNSVLNGLTNVNATNNIGLEWDACGAPLSDALYAAGYYFQSKTAPTPFSEYLGSHPKSSNFNVPDGVCFECGFNAIILLSGGDPSEEGKLLTLPSAIASDPAPCVGCSPSNLHKVAKFLWQKDLRSDMAGQQRVATYTIGFSDDAADSKLLQETARLGGGRFSPARSTSELKRVILSMLDDINARNTSFSAAAVNTLQTQSAALTAVVPRMLPVKDKAWLGKLYRYDQYNEFVEDQDKNGDGDRGDIFLVDSTDTIVAEDSSGEYRKVLSTTGGPGGTPLYGDTAEPFWEASKELEALGHARRNIWTVTDNGLASGGGAKDNLLTEKDDLIAFNLANIGHLRQYLAVSGAPLCPSGSGLTFKRGLILDRMGMDTTTAATMMTNAGLTDPTVVLMNQESYDLLCTALIIQYVRGQDLFDEDGDGSRTDTRLSALGDIFHSSPVVVDPPVDKFLCDLGINNQCVRTLYDSKARTGLEATPMIPRDDLPTACNIPAPMSRDAYDAYHFINRKRERVILVGANDGMLHAFSDGLGQENSSTCEIFYPSTGAEGGRERWAFIPPDLLPRLQEMLQGHAYYVDGDIMVRDIWADSGKNVGSKDWDEYHTVAVVAEGRGGTHYFALEILWNSDGSAASGVKDRPGFRWMFPQPCTDEALTFGKTLLSLSPKPPPIGPVLLEGSDTVGQKRHGKDGPNSVERWIALLSGGWSPGGEKGRGVYMVDVWNGTMPGRRDNLLWKWEYSASATGSGEEPRRYLTHGIAAPVALADYGANERPGFDGFFDTGVVGDLGGQLWTLRFFQPGRLDDTTKLVNNWSGARSFVMDRDGVSAGDPRSVRNRAPFYYLTSLAVQPETKALRAFAGTGNRYALLENGAGTCRFDNPLACSKLGCGQTLLSYQLTRNDTQYQSMSNEWADRLYTAGKSSAWSGTAPTNLCGSVGDMDFVRAEFANRKTLTCPKPSTSGTLDYEFARTKVECGQNDLGVFNCRVRDPGNILNMNDLDVNATATASTLGKNRFYGIWAYGGVASRMFVENPSSTAATLAKQYDDVRLTDSGGTTGTGHLVDVTNIECDALGNCKCAAGKVCTGSKLTAGTDDLGWFYEYEGLAHKTASGSAVLGSCALWNAMYPGSTTGGACSSTGTNLARLYQADYVSGAPNCASGFLGSTGYARYQSRSVIAPPPEPATVIQVSKTGQVKYSAMFLEPGKSQATEAQVSSDMDVLQYIYELPVSRGLHACRHDNGPNGGQETCIPSEL
jgi:type IV pilus assembly protein PilY1